MNPSYVRIQLLQDIALPRFTSWLNLPEIEPPTVVASGQEIDLATEGSQWRGAAFFIYENNGWTVFEDMTGYLGTKSSQDWLRLAGQEALVFAGYNDAVPYAELIVILEGQVIRKFRDDEQDPSQNVNEGRLGFENIYPIQRWVEAASYVDGDALASAPEYGTLYLFQFPA